MLTQGDATGDRSLVDWARDDLKRRYQKPGNVFVGLVHRLDRPVSGVVLLAKTSKGASRLSEQFRARDGREGLLGDRRGGAGGRRRGRGRTNSIKDERRNVVRVAEGEEGREATLGYRVLERWRGRSWLEVRPVSGRSHQIRVQLASRGLPILGDAKYGARSRVAASDGGHRIALHARSLTLQASDSPGSGFGDRGGADRLARAFGLKQTDETAEPLQ